MISGRQSEEQRVRHHLCGSRWMSLPLISGPTQILMTHRAAAWNPLAPQPQHNFMLHGVLALLVQAWPVDFHQLPVGIRHGCSEVQQPFRNMKGKTGWPRINITRGDDKHVICFIIVVALLVCDQLYAHPKKRTGEKSVNGRLVASPVCIGGNEISTGDWRHHSRH